MRRNEGMSSTFTLTHEFVKYLRNNLKNEGGDIAMS